MGQWRWRAVAAEVSVVGYDDILGADFCSPPLTTLAGPRENAGRTLVDVLLELLDPVRRAAAGPPARRLVLPTHLAIRGSTGPVAGKRSRTGPVPRNPRHRPGATHTAT